MTKQSFVDAVAFLKLWKFEGPWILTAISTDKKFIQTRTFTPETEDKLENWLLEHNGKNNLYFHVNSTIGELSKKAERQDIKSVDWLHVDIDPRVREDVHEERARIIHLLKNPPPSIPRPTCIIFSGGGYQAFWKLEVPLDINGDLSTAEEVKRYNLQLEVIFGGDHCHNIDRIMRLPGTMNMPDAKKRKLGREAIQAQLVEFNAECVYPISKFIAAPDFQDPKLTGLASGQTISIATETNRLTSIDELDKWNVPERTKVIIVQGEHPDEITKKEDTSRSAWLFDAVCAMARAGVPPEVMYSVITDPDYRISASVLDKGLSAERYAKKQIESALDKAIDPDLSRMNERYAVIKNIGGKCRIVEEVEDLALKRKRLTHMTFGDFKNAWMNIGVEVGRNKKGDAITVPLGQWWLSHPRRREFDCVTFSPRLNNPNVYNLWQGFSVSAVPGDCSLFLDHIKRNICSGNLEHYNYLMGWMANAVQNPDSPGHVAVVMRGKRGTGKGFFAKQFGSLFGRHFMHVSDPKHLVGSFNSHLRDCVVLFGDESFYAGDKKHESMLKTLITEETFALEAKGYDVEISPNFVHLILASNSHWVVPAGADERRFFVLEIGDDNQQDTTYFKKVAAQLDNGGREAFLSLLLSYKLEDFDVRKAPRTVGLLSQKLLSMTSEEEWWYKKLVEGELVSSIEGWPKEVLADEIRRDYTNYLDQYKIYSRINSTGLFNFLKRVAPGMGHVQRHARHSGIDEHGLPVDVVRKRYFYIFPDLKTCRHAWRIAYGTDTDELPDSVD